MAETGFMGEIVDGRAADGADGVVVVMSVLLWGHSVPDTLAHRHTSTFQIQTEMETSVYFYFHF